MPENMDYALYFNIIFFSVIAIGFIVGYIRGYKKTLFALVAMSIFYAFFFITIDQVVNQLWVLRIPFAIDYLTSYLPDLAGLSTIGEAVFKMLEVYVGDQMGDTLSNTMFISFVTGLSQFVLKLIYTLFYFTFGQVIFKWLVFIFRLLFIKNKAANMAGVAKPKRNRKNKLTRKEKRAQKKEYEKQLRLNKKLKSKEKKPLLGAAFGAMKGAVTAFVSLIVIGGMLNMSESLLMVLADDGGDSAIVYEEPIYLSSTYHREFSTMPVELASGLPVPSELQAQITQARDMVTAFNSNLFVQSASTILITSPEYSEPIAMHLYLFDAVFSFDFDDNQVMLRNEINVFAEAGAIILNSDYMESNDLSDISSEEIIDVFNQISKSDLITTLIPLGIEVGSDYFDMPVDMPVDDLYAIDWESELMTLGAIVAVGFDLVNTAGILDDSTDLETVTIDGDEVEDLFDSLADSELATLAAYVAIEPLLEEMGGDFSAIITVPADLEWDDEFTAFGQVAKAVLDTGITVGDLESADPSVLIGALADMDFTILLNSEIVSHALKNIFSGDAGLDGLDMIIVPDGIVWFDVYDDGGNLVAAGELRNILTAVNAITDVAGGFDFENLDFEIIADFDDPAIDAIFDSNILVASISGYLLDMDLGDTPLVIPDSVLDSNDYILSSELKAIANSARVLVTDLACDDGDTVCEETGFDIAKAFGLSDTAIDTLTSSDILAATIGQLIIDSGGDMLTIPNSALMTIAVDSVDQDVVSKGEIKKLFQAVSVLGFDDLDNMEFDASIIQNLGLELEPTTLDQTKSDKLFGSRIVLATLSDMLFEQTEGANSALAVPYFDVDGVAVRAYDAGDDLEYLSTAELENVLQALLSLDITDFADVDGLDLNLIIDNSAILLDSAILHATISKQMFDLGGDILAVPYKDENANLIRITVGDALAETDTEYIAKTEIENILDGLEILDISDISSFDGTVDLASITSEPGNIDTLLSSAIIHATISDQLINLDTDGTIKIPYLEEDNATAVRVTVGDVGFETEYVTKDEINAMVDALDVLGIVDFESFDGTLDLASITSEPGNMDILLSSAIIHATVSKQLIDLDTSGTILVPHLEEDNATAVRVTVGGVGHETEYVTKDEINAMIDALDILDIIDVESFDGTVDLGVLTVGNNMATVLSSAILQATISKQLIDLDTNGTIDLPYFKEDDLTKVRFTVGTGASETEYVLKAELEAMIDAMDVLDIDDIETFDGSVDLSVLTVGNNMDTVLASAMIQATVSKQIIDLTTNPAMAATFIVPYWAEDNTTKIRISVGDPLQNTDTDYILASEISAMIDGLDILGITDVETFDGSIDLTGFYDETNRNILLSSSIMQATVSKQLIDLGDAILLIPVQDVDTVQVRVTVGALTEVTEYVSKTEIGAMFEALEVLGFDDINNFSGNIDLNNVYGTTNQDVILGSAAMHATISKQMKDLGPAVLYVPNTDIDGVSIQKTVLTTNFIEKNEIKAMINALEILGITDINNFSGTFDLTALATEASQNTLLSSASIHATITKTLLDLNSAVLIVPHYTQAGEVPGNEIRKTVSGTEFVVKAEIKALINSFNTMGYSDLESFGAGIDSSKFFSGRVVLLSSSSIQATLSDKMLNDTGGELIVPDANVNTTTDIRLVQADVTYIEIGEMNAILDALDELGLTDFSAMAFSPANVFTVDYNLIFASASIQATVSANILPTANLETVAAGTAGLIVPAYFRQDITVDGVAEKHIELVELKALLGALKVLGVNDFNGGMDAGVITNLDEAKLTEMLISGSVHTTIDNMMRGNSNIASKIPDLALASPAKLYKANLISKTEITAFILATQTIASGSFTSVDFDVNDLTGLTAAEQDTVATSMIVRNMLTPDLVNTVAPAKSYTIEASDYMNNDTGTFLTKSTVLLLVS